MVWKGVIIEESLEDKDLLDMVKIVATKKTMLEKEHEKGVLNFHRIELDDNQKDEVIARSKSAIKNGWYLHVCKNGKMAVVFKSKHFEFSEKGKETMNEARKYGLSVGIIKDQLTFENLIKNTYG